MAASGNEAMTIKQLKDYADSNQLKTGTMQEFCEYMGIPYVPPLFVSDVDWLTFDEQEWNGSKTSPVISKLVVTTTETSTESTVVGHIVGGVTPPRKAEQYSAQATSYARAPSLILTITINEDGTVEAQCDSASTYTFRDIGWQDPNGGGAVSDK